MSYEIEVMPEKTISDIIKKETVLFICTGNTCRSPMCAALFNDKYAGFTRHAVSAGLMADGSPISENAVQALKNRGVVSRKPDNDYTSHISQNVTEAMMEEADIVVGVTSSHAMQLMLSFPQYASKITVMPEEISDPFGGSLAQYEKCLDDIDKALSAAFGIQPENGNNNKNEDH